MNAVAPSEDPWAVLGLAATAGDEDVREAYRAGVRAHPPERDPEGFKRVRAAYEALRDPVQRARTAVLGRPLLPEIESLRPSDLEIAPLALPGAAVLRGDLLHLLLAGTELDPGDFSPDLRPLPD